MSPELVDLLTRIGERLTRIEAALGAPSPQTFSVKEASALRGRSVRHVYGLIEAGVVVPTGPRPYRIPAEQLSRIR